VKKRTAIRDACARGVRIFAFDSEEELDKLIDLAPGATVFCRVLCDGSGADWPLSRKFGCDPELALTLLCARRAPASTSVCRSTSVRSNVTRGRGTVYLPSLPISSQPWAPKVAPKVSSPQS
jgi:diaminopimelate decarboxylase